MEHRFVVQPVGQGLFYTGEINIPNDKDNDSTRFNLVYDCGSGKTATINDKSNFACLIDDYVKHLKTNIIDMLVVSHFDSDHANGLPILLKNVDKVHQLFLPYTGKNGVLMLQSLLYLTESFSKVEEIIFVKENTNDSEEEYILEELRSESSEFDESIYVDQSYRDKIKIIKSSKIISSKIEWKFKFYNMQNTKENNINLKDRFDEIFAINNFASITELLTKKRCKDPKDNKEKNVKTIVKDLYIEVLEFDKDTSNKSSLCLYHIPIFFEYSVIIQSKDVLHFPGYYSQFGHDSISGTLLTGDINISDDVEANKFRNFYEKELPKILYFFLPHHGSYLNWNDSLFLDVRSHIFFIVSAGKINKYQHPSSSIISKVHFKKHLTFIAEETNLVEYFVKGHDKM